MRALTIKQRRFVLELRHGPAGYGSEVRAARAAGYGTPGSSDLALRVEAHRQLHSDKVQAALREIGGKIIRAEAFQSIKNTVAIANDEAIRRRCSGWNIFNPNGGADYDIFNP
jgi:phage terminase small subunit